MREGEGHSHRVYLQNSLRGVVIEDEGAINIAEGVNHSLLGLLRTPRQTLQETDNDGRTRIPKEAKEFKGHTCDMHGIKKYRLLVPQVQRKTQLEVLGLYFDPSSHTLPGS